MQNDRPPTGTPPVSRHWPEAGWPGRCCGVVVRVQRLGLGAGNPSGPADPERDWVRHARRRRPPGRGRGGGRGPPRRPAQRPTYTVTGPELISVPDQAAQLAELLGRPLGTVDVPPAAVESQLLAAGFDRSFVDVAVRGQQLVRDGGNALVTDDVARVLGRPARTFRTWAADHRVPSHCRNGARCGMTGRALVLGGTGMLAGCVAALVGDGWHVVLPSRRHAPIPAEPIERGEFKPGAYARAALAVARAQAVQCRAQSVVGGGRLVRARPVRRPCRPGPGWVRRPAGGVGARGDRARVMQAVRPLLAPAAPVVEVLGSDRRPAARRTRCSPATRPSRSSCLSASAANPLAHPRRDLRRGARRREPGNRGPCAGVHQLGEVPMPDGHRG